MNLTFKAINHRDTLLAQVIALGDKNSKTLGMLPEGAFFHHAKMKTIIVALDSNEFAGYILFRISQRKRLVSITHLCVHDDYRSRGISTLLLKEVKRKYESLFRGIILTCREDYKNASKLWENFGFKAIYRKRSRSKEEHHLIKWLYDFGNPDLFSHSEKEDERVKALIDCSVLIPMSESLSENNVESHALLADWLHEEAEFVFAPEVFNELNRDADKTRAQKTREFLKRFDTVIFKPDIRDKIFNALQTIKPGNTSNDLSDRKQLAECIVSNTPYFITLDSDILAVSEDLFKDYSIHVLRPIDFILLIDESSNNLDYHSLRLAGANYETGRIKSDEVEIIVDLFSGMHQEERKPDLRNAIIKCASDLKNGLVRVVSDKEKIRIAAYGIRIESDVVLLEFIRVKKLKIANVLFQQLVKDIIAFSIGKKLHRIIINENRLSDAQENILALMGFVKSNDTWEKISLSGLFTFDELLSNTLIKNSVDTENILNKINSSEGLLKEVLKVELERKLWPVKISDISIPAYIIPIKPHWASHLFDFYISNSNLFGASETLSWNRENVYYRSVNPVSEKSPARILWYLSSEDKSATGRNKGIAACSYLDEVSVDRVKLIFQKYKHFGIYKWEDVYKLAHKEIMSDIKALKFSSTEVFKNIIPLKEVDKIMIQNNRPKNTFASPVEVSVDIFNSIYKLGINE
jgi:ribosomal protein S18 acetylase RimI-like enzyme/predicted nucleic acid-binding protein